MKKKLKLDDWYLLAELLERYDSLEADAQGSFLDQAKISHPHLAEKLELEILQKRKVDIFLKKGPGDNLRLQLPTEPAPEPPPLPALQGVIGRYRILERVKRGGMAEIYKAELTGAGRFSKCVAIKKILAQYANHEEVKIAFEQEARISSVLIHPNIAQTFDCFSNSQGIFLVIEYVHGKNLKEIIAALKTKQQSIPIRLIIHIINEVAKGLEIAHSQKDVHGREMNIVHRDISPQNIMISFDGSVKLLDFGIAKATGNARTATGVTKGKFAYMSPEQAIAAKVDRRTDIYSLGLVLYELLVLKRAISGTKELEVYTNARQGNLASLPQSIINSCPQVATILKKALSPNPDNRYSSATEMRMALNQIDLSGSALFENKELSELMNLLFPGRPQINSRKGNLK